MWGAPDDRAGYLPAIPSTSDALTSTPIPARVATPRNVEEQVLDDELRASEQLVTDDDDSTYGDDRFVDDASASSGGFECEGESLAGVHVRVEVASVHVDDRDGDSDEDAELVADAVRRWQVGGNGSHSRTRRAATSSSPRGDEIPRTRPRLFTYSTLPTHPMHPRTFDGARDASLDDADDEALARAMWSRSERTAGGAAVGPPPDDETEETRETEDAANFSVRGDANVRGAYARTVFPETLETPHPDQTRRSPTAAASTPVPALARRTVPRSCPRDVASPESRLAAYAAAPRRGSRQVSRTNFPRRWVAARAPESRDGKHPNRENRLNRFPTRLGGSHVGGSFVFVKDATNDALATRSEVAESRRGDGDERSDGGLEGSARSRGEPRRTSSRPSTGARAAPAAAGSGGSRAGSLAGSRPTTGGTRAGSRPATGERTK